MNGGDDQSVFLVDADDIVRDSLKILIESHGLRVKDYRSAADFLAEADAPNATCLIFGCNRHIMDGIDLVHALRRKGIDLPVIFVVGGGNASTKAAVVAARVGAYLESPIDEGALMRSIEAVIAQRDQQEKYQPQAEDSQDSANRRPLKH